MMKPVLSVALWGLLLGCSESKISEVVDTGEASTTTPVDEYEGDEPGECSDDADNDRDGLFDCDDEGCAGSAACATTTPSTGTTATTSTTATSTTGTSTTSSTTSTTTTPVPVGPCGPKGVAPEFYFGDLTFTTEEAMRGFCKSSDAITVIGDIQLVGGDIETTEGLGCIRRVEGTLYVADVDIPRMEFECLESVTEDLSLTLYSGDPPEQAIESIIFPKLESVGGMTLARSLFSLSEVHLPVLSEIHSLEFSGQSEDDGFEPLLTLEFPGLRRIEGYISIASFNNLSTLEMPSLEYVGVYDDPDDERAGIYIYETNIPSISFNVPAIVGALSLDGNDSLTDLSGLASLRQTGWGAFSINDNDRLTDLSPLAGLESLLGCMSFERNELLADLTPVFGLESVHCVNINSNPSLCTSHAEDFIDSIGEFTSEGHVPSMAFNDDC